jgi:uncharacterized protein YjbI with pentapeptide repeats
MMDGVPAMEDAGWAAYWAARGMPWRTQPEISSERQAELAELRVIVADRDAGVFPFQGVALTRADIEWLLATHEGGRGPVTWEEERDKRPKERRQGLDLRATDLTGLDLSGMPLTGLMGGPIFTLTSRQGGQMEEGEAGIITLKDANLSGARLEGAQLSRAQLDGVRLTGAKLNGALLAFTHLDGADLTSADLGDAFIYKAQMTSAMLRDANLEKATVAWNVLKRADLREVRLDRAYLDGCECEEADLRGVSFAGARLPSAKFSHARLDGASFEGALISHILDFTSASLVRVSARGCTLTNWDCTKADCTGADFTGATFVKGQLVETDLSDAHLERTTFTETELTGVILSGAHLAGTDLAGAQLGPHRIRSTDYRQPDTLVPSNLTGADLTGANLCDARLDSACLKDALLAGADLTRARLEGADLSGARCDGARLEQAYLKGATLDGTSLAGADLREAVLDAATTLRRIGLRDRMHGPVRLAGVRWAGVDLHAVDWAKMPVLGDELEARRGRDAEGRRKARSGRITEHVDALRVYRQLALAVDDKQEEPLLKVNRSKVAVNYDYRAQLLQRRVYWLRRDYGRWIFASLLWGLVGFGYRMGRILAVYALAICLFTALYLAVGAVSGPPASPLDALLTSITAFHGRVFAGQFSLGTPQSWVAAAESITGLIVESVFIAMLTQRFFGK